MSPKDRFGIPHETLDVTRARYHLTRLLRRLRTQPRAYVITQRGKPAGALVNLDWLQALLDRARSKRPFSLAGQATATEDWEQALAEIRRSVEQQILDRYDAVERQNPGDGLRR